MTDLKSEAEAGAEKLDESRDGWTFQMFGEPTFASDPRPYFHWLRQTPPKRDDLVMEGKAPTVVVSRYEDVEATLRNPKLFSSQFGEGMGGLGNDRPLIPLMVDPPHHKKYRVLLDPYLAPRQMARLEQEVSDLVNELIDGFIARGSCNFVEEFAVPLPCTVFLKLLGLPLELLDFFLDIKEGIVRGNSEPDFVKAAEARVVAGKRCYEYFEAALDRIALEQTPGLLLDLLGAEVEGERLTRDEIMDICYLFIIAGLDTVTDSLCCFWTHLAAHDDDRARVANDPAVVPAAVEELLRWESPVSGVARLVTEDGDFNGCPVHKGDSVLVLVGAANTDPSGIDDAARVDFDRPVNRHFAFGGGIHRCLGSNLARLELRVAIREWHRRIPEYAVAEGTKLFWTPMLRSVLELPLVFPV